MGNYYYHVRFTSVVASEGCDTTVTINIFPLEDFIPFYITSHIYPHYLFSNRHFKHYSIVEFSFA